jgi:hypothetical protein
MSQSVNFTGGNLIIDLPAGSYADCRKVCIVVAQKIPDTTTINAPVFITIGGGAVQYPLMKRNCRQVVASGLRTRTRYKTVVETTNDSGLFRMIGEPCCTPDNRLAAINGEGVPATTDGGE